MTGNTRQLSPGVEKITEGQQDIAWRTLSILVDIAIERAYLGCSRNGAETYDEKGEKGYQST